MAVDDEEHRRTHYATIRVELEDSTDEEALHFWQALSDGEQAGEIEIDGFVASVIEVTPTGTRP